MSARPHRFTPLSLSFKIPFLRNHFHLIYLIISLNQSSPFPVCWARGASPRGKLLYGQTWLETPDPVRSPKLSNHGRVQYSGGGPPGKRTYCTVFSKFKHVGRQPEVRTSVHGSLGEKRPSVAAGMCERRGLAVVLPQSGGFDSHPALRRKSDDPSQYHI